LASGYNRNWVSNADNWTTTSVNADGTSQDGYPEYDHITGQTTGNQVIVQLDYTQPLNDSTKWEMGMRSFTYIRDQQYFFNQFNGSSEEFVLLPTYSQNAHITETVNALYALYTTKLRGSISLQAGLRVEQSALKGVSRFEPVSHFGFDYPSSSGGNWIKAFFPSFSLVKNLTKDSEIGISLSRKIGRPGWRQFFVGIQSSDRQNVTIGNPALQPEFVNTGELNYSRFWENISLLSTAYYIYEDNTIKPLVQPSVDDPSILVTTYANVKADIRGGLDNTLTVTFGKNFNVMANINAFNFTLQTDTYKRTKWAYNAKLNLNYNFPKNITAQLSTSNNSVTPQLQGSRSAVRSADFAVRKSFWDNRGSIVFTLNDIFNSRKQAIIYDQPTAYQRSMNRREVRFYKITLQFPLSRTESQRKKKDLKIARPDVDFSN
jgi:outer membrane receptor protein involved in Fe transport